MDFLDTVKEGLRRVVPSGSSKKAPAGFGGTTGISSSGAIGFEDDMIISKPAIVFHVSQIFFNFLAMACFASVAAFQAKWKVGPSGLSGFTLFITILGMFLSAFMLVIPVLYEKYDKFVRLARALKEVRVGFILTGTGSIASLLIAFIVTISAWTEAGCKNPDNDPNASKGNDFKNGLSGWCSTKKAAAIFLWLAFVFWAASLTLLIINWRQGKLLGPRDPPFERPTDDEYQVGQTHDEDEDEDFTHIPPVQNAAANSGAPAGENPFNDSNRYSAASSGAPTYSYAAASSYTPPASRPSMDAYGAFSDPPPSGFGTASPARASATPPSLPQPDLGPQVSRTMQYADPYAAVRASLASGQQRQQAAANTSPDPYGATPAYDYTGYR
ncbi:hypothetical protein GYMLUDRAFT_41546 [Collybiopsis luxurians FD-317 M1]|uniref:Unplaced genomic scaffold GYMLUscaffold_17, whole genome shotgun sequence n=1 Tax=Collybiopsis luxurians FD-317 M1 TaxID=944289 RepID=A0A0D0CUJ8_9AGAR|nr:hypothetical protein GYMLUDRAFT_41546 [Collybiopsis luxurians FD-317 M1]